MLAQRIQLLNRPIITKGLIGRWLCGPADGNDYSGSGYNGTLVNSPTFTDAPHGRGGKFVTNQYVSMGVVSGLDSSSTQALSFWFRWNSLSIAAKPHLYCQQKIGANYDCQIKVGIGSYGGGPAEGTSKLCVCAYNGSPNWGAYGAYTTQTFAGDTAWHHGFFQYNGSIWQIYIDGEADYNAQLGTADGLAHAPNGTSGQDVVIAADSGGGIAKFPDAELFDVRRYNEAKTHDEIKLIYQGVG